MELPFYLRILPPEALEVLAYFRRQGSNLAYADAMMTATELSERGFGKAIRRLVTKGYLVLDGDQRYRLTEHGQRAVDDLPASMAGRAPDTYADDEPEVEHIPVDSSDNFDSLFGSDSSGSDLDMDGLFDETDDDEDSGEPASNLVAQRYADDETVERLFGGDNQDDVDEGDDLFAELDEEGAAAFEDLFGDMDDEAEAISAPSNSAVPPEPVTETSPAETLAASSDEDLFADFEDLFGDMTEITNALDEAIATDDVSAESGMPATTDDSLAERILDNADRLVEALPSVMPLPDESLPMLDSADLFEWLEIDSDSASEDTFDLWGASATEEDEAAVDHMPAEQVASRVIARRLIVALPQPLVAEQSAHVMVGILPDDGGSIAEPVQLIVRLAVLNGTPAHAHELPLLLTNGLTRQDLTITPGRFAQVRLRVQIYQVNADEATLCGGMYVDADVVDNTESAQTPVAFGVDTQFVLNG